MSAIEVNLNLTPELINQYVQEAIIESSVGDFVKKTIDNVIKEFGDYRFQEQVAADVKREVFGIARKVLSDQYTDQIEAAVKKAFTKERMEDLINAASEQVFRVANSAILRGSCD